MKKTVRKLVALFAAMIVGFVLFVGCGNSDSGADKENKTEMTVGVTSFADTLEPTEQYFSWVVSRYGVGETLVKFDERGESVPYLAEKWEVSQDKLTWTFTIRKGVKFSNGEDMTPELVKKSLERTFSKSDRAAGFFSLDSIEVEGQTLHIKTKKPSATVPGSLADPLFLIVNTNVDTDSFALNGPICTGPYMVESFNPTELCVVVKNQHYWGGEVPFEKVTLKCIDDQSTRSMALQSGEIDIAYNLKTENIKEFENNNDMEILKLDSLRTTYSFMNQNGALKDKVLRQALIRGLDRETYCNTILKGGAKAGKAPVPPTLDFGFDQLKDENSYNPESAKELLQKAGYKDLDGDGYLETPDGKTLDLQFVIYTSREELGLYAQAAQVSLKEIGIKVTLDTVSYETLLDRRDAGKYDLLIWNVLVANTGDPENYLRENWYSNSPSNTTGYQDENVDKLIDQLSSELDDKKREGLVTEIQQLIMNDAATAFFGYETTYLFHSKNVTGVTMYPMDYYWLTAEIKPAN